MRLSPIYPITHYSLYFMLLLPIDLNWRWLQPQPIVLKIPERAEVETWMYHLQGRAVEEIQLICSWSHLLQDHKGYHILVLELPWKLQPKVHGAQQNLRAHGIIHIPVVPVCLVILSLLGVQ